MKLPPVIHSGDLDRNGLEKAVNDDEAVGACLTGLDNNGTKSVVTLDDANSPATAVKLVLSGETPPAKATLICTGTVILTKDETKIRAFRLP